MPENLSKLRYYGRKEGLFTNGCKKTLKLVQNVQKIIHENEVQDEELSDTFVMYIKVKYKDMKVAICKL